MSAKREQAHRLRSTLGPDSMGEASELASEIRRAARRYGGEASVAGLAGMLGYKSAPVECRYTTLWHFGLAVHNV